MSPSVIITILISVVLTSALSGVLGMAGGMILMAILVMLLPVAQAMVLHGVTQGMANGLRAWIHRKHIVWKPMLPYAVGAFLALLAFTAMTVLPSANVVMLLVGFFPWIGRLVPQFKNLDVTKPQTAISCGLLVTTAQLLAGASGPLLDVFYLNTTMTRHQVIASKALTQTLGHLIKIGYYGFVFGAATVGNYGVFVGCMLSAVIGTQLGTRLLDRLSDTQFRRISGYVIQAIGAACILRGGYGLLIG